MTLGRAKHKKVTKYGRILAIPACRQAGLRNRKSQDEFNNSF
jgi:hypothetical protein